TNEIITIDDEFNVKIFLDGKCLNNHNLIKKRILLADMVEREAKFEKNPERMLFEKLDFDKFITNSITMGELLIWDVNLNVIVKKICHSSNDITLFPCKNGFLVSKSNKDGEIKVWNAQNLSLKLSEEDLKRSRKRKN
ncbi:hypothetical protein BpHYR1_001184, partial [Brachionus plicatilis]